MDGLIVGEFVPQGESSGGRKQMSKQDRFIVEVHQVESTVGVFVQKM